MVDEYYSEEFGCVVRHFNAASKVNLATGARSPYRATGAPTDPEPVGGESKGAFNAAKEFIQEGASLDQLRALAERPARLQGPAIRRKTKPSRLSKAAPQAATRGLQGAALREFERAAGVRQAATGSAA